MSNNDNLTLATDNFQLAAYLLAESCELISFDKTNPRRVIFIFKSSKKLEELHQQFLSYKGLIEPHRFFSAQKDLKQIIYQNK